MSIRPRSDLKSTAPTRGSATLNPLAANDLTVLAATSFPLAPSAREALTTTTAYYQSEFHEELVELLCAAPSATDVIDAAIAAEHFSAPASALKASG